MTRDPREFEWTSDSFWEGLAEHIQKALGLPPLNDEEMRQAVELTKELDAMVQERAKERE